ncbi:MAG: DUF692 family multinuclear iron-containing protein [Bacteroidia bacterium]
MDRNILASALPLFEDGKVEAIEWSFDALFKVRNIPAWFVELLDRYSNANSLLGHGVFFSLFSGRWTAEQERWLAHLKKVSNEFNFTHITEHFGFMTGENFHQGAPISIPFTTTTLAIGRDRLKRIYHACQCPVGLENLAFAYSIDEVKRHGEFLEELISPINGFIILDLHNLYCQLHNFGLSFEEIIQLYPLHRVKEIHISGGSWKDSTIEPDRKIRRDTHDERVPDEVFSLLEKAIPLCPSVEFIVLEQIGTGLQSDEAKDQFRVDFDRMNAIVNNQKEDSISTNNFLPHLPITTGPPAQNEQLHLDQMELSHIIEHATSYSDAMNKLRASRLANSDWEIEKWQPGMVETVVDIAQKWKDGF